jgi:tetratricopeptide (TPR) repeat protein
MQRALLVAAVGTLMMLATLSTRAVLRAPAPPLPVETYPTRPSTIHVEPSPIATEVVFVGPEGDDDDGWPRRAVDRTALLALLRAGRHHELTQQIESIQASFERDASRERWITDVMFAFRQADPDLATPIDAWVAAEPTSFAPLLARCSYLDAVAWQRRGGAYASATPSGSMDGMHEAMQRAQADCEAALERAPRLIVARQRLLAMASAQGDRASARRQLELALDACPSCFGIRDLALTYLQPRWGGSLDVMRAFADEAIRTHPEARYLGRLAAEAPLESCRLRTATQPQQALRDCDAAVGAGEIAIAYRQRGRLRLQLTQRDAAIADYEHALMLDPQYVDALTEHADLIGATRPDEAARELLVAARLDPLDEGAMAGVVWARERARSDAFVAASRDDAPATDLALERARVLGIEATELDAWRAELAPIARLAAELAASPDSIDVLRRMDAALLQRGETDAVLAMWDGYLARHPDDGAAFFERAGTHSQRREREATQADARRACDLGTVEACPLAGPRSAP